MKRYAIVKNADSRRQLEAYLPDNYKIVYAFVTQGYDADDQPLREAGEDEQQQWGIKPGEKLFLGFVIQGEDVAGWTFEDYVEPRLASGLIYATEIDLSHPIMKHVPA